MTERWVTLVWGKNLSGQLITEASQQTASVIALDLNGDGVITVTKKATGNGVLFDVDNDGFAEETDWIGPRDGILVLDWNSSGEGSVEFNALTSTLPLPRATVLGVGLAA